MINLSLGKGLIKSEEKKMSKFKVGDKIRRKPDCQDNPGYIQWDCFKVRNKLSSNEVFIVELEETDYRNMVIRSEGRGLDDKSWAEKNFELVSPESSLDNMEKRRLYQAIVVDKKLGEVIAKEDLVASSDNLALFKLGIEQSAKLKGKNVDDLHIDLKVLTEFEVKESKETEKEAKK